MKKLIFILCALLAISTTAQTVPAYKTVKLTGLSTGGSNDDILTIGADKTVKKVAKSSITTDISGKENTIAPGTTAQYWRGDKTWKTLPTYTLSGLGGVPTTRTLTINGVAQDLSADRSWTIPGGGGGSTAPLEFNTADFTVWNNGKGNIVDNTSFGTVALSLNTTGSGNTANGYGALNFNTTGSYNTGLGSFTLQQNSIGSYNTAVGVYAGARDGESASNIMGSTFLGCFAQPQDDNQTNQIVIGYQATGAGSNTVTLGNTDITLTVLRGQVNMGSMKLNTMNTAPTSATATGTVGEIRVTATHIYVCTATNTWVRTALTTW